MRAHLARLLTGEPDLLMLDEPTNHLDLEALLWFQEYLRNYPGAILVISHDREFLNRLVNGIVEIRSRKLHRFAGNYERYVQQKDLQREQQQAAYDKQKKEIENLKAFIDRFGAKASKAAQAQSKLKQIERMEKLEAPEADGPKLRFKFPQPLRSGRDVIFLKDIHMAYGPNVVYRGMNFHGERGHRTVLVGPNGAGKSTLLKLLAGVLTPQSGARELGYQAKAGYFAQYRLDTLQAGRTVLEEGIDAALQASVRATEEFVRTVLGAFLFRGDDVFKKVSVLSGGEKSRLALVKLLLDPPNLLLMDEPTTHLDIPSIDALVAALKQYEGTLIFISHDVYFIKAIADHVVHVNAGVLTKYEGDYQYYLDRTAAISARVGLTATGTTGIAEPEKSDKAPKGENRKEQRRREAEARQDKSRIRIKLSHQVQKLEAEMQQLEARLAELTAELEKPETYDTPGKTMEINKELGAVNKKLPAVTAEWETASSQLAEIAG
jgi:ATP-binding cassette subfamily F protein 3